MGFALSAVALFLLQIVALVCSLVAAHKATDINKNQFEGWNTYHYKYLAARARFWKRLWVAGWVITALLTQLAGFGFMQLILARQVTPLTARIMLAVWICSFSLFGLFCYARALRAYRRKHIWTLENI